MLAAIPNKSELGKLARPVLNPVRAVFLGRLADMDSAHGQLIEAREGDTARLEIRERLLANFRDTKLLTMTNREREKLSKMEDVLANHVAGQREAVKVVSTTIRSTLAGVRDNNRPMGSFLFLGLSGVGKARLCSALAHFLFGNDESVVRIDMGAFTDEDSVGRLIGAPIGGAAWVEGGCLTEPVRRQPLSVILLDDVEKANSNVFRVLLQVIEKGCLTDGQRRLVSFRSSVLILTSSLRSGVLNDLSGTVDVARSLIEAAMLEAVPSAFWREVIHHLDDIVIFRSQEDDVDPPSIPPPA